MVDYSKWNKMEFSDSDSDSDIEEDNNGGSRVMALDQPGKGDCFSDDDDRSAFGNIRIGAEYYDEHLRYVKHNDPESTYLNLNHMDEFTNRAWARVGSIVKNNTHVRRVNLSGCDLESGFTALMEGGLMDRNAPLTGLSLTQNTHIFHYGNDKLLGKYLEKNKDMEDLDLEETDVTPDTLMNILPGLDGSKLQDLNISHGCPIWQYWYYYSYLGWCLENI